MYMLHNDLKKLDKYPFHMPGHKRNDKFGIIGSEIDITEIDGYDNLHSPAGSILEIENKLTNIYTAEKSFMLINGSTVGILSAILAVTKKNDTVIVARNCHQSVYNACLLNELNVFYIEPEYDEIHGFYKEITQTAVDAALLKHKNAAAVVITSPTYEGYISSISSPVPLIIDAAHGAHFGFSDFPEYPQADIVISSLHKTLPALTQTAVVNVYNKNYIAKIKKYLDILQTSSPSYVLMNSVSKCIQIIKDAPYLFDRLYKNLIDFYKIKLNHLELIKSDDISKIIISTAKTNINGIQLTEILRNNYHIECEMTSINYIILMSSIGDEQSAFERLKNALIEIDCSLKSSEIKKINKPPVPIKINNQHEITKTKKTALENSNGMTSGETIFAYPPDIPIIVKGEIISAEIIEYIHQCFQNGINIISESNLLPRFILTKADE